MGEVPMTDGDEAKENNHWSNSAWFGAVVITSFVIIGYAHSIQGKFVFDDEGLIETRDSVHEFDVVAFFESDRPFLLFTFAINYAIGNLNPLTYHIVNIAIHISASIVLFLLLRNVLGSNRFSTDWESNGIALAASLLWAVHPLQTQSVTYIVQRGESLCGLMLLLCLLMTFKSKISKRGYLFQIGVVTCCTIGMFTKGVMITAPLLILLFDKLALQSSWKSILRRRFMYFGVMAGSLSFILHMALKYEPVSRTLTGSIKHAGTPLEYLYTQTSVILHYLYLSFWPRTLCIDYKWPVAREFTTTIAASGLLLLSLLVISLLLTYYRPRLGFIGLAFFIVLAPTSSFIPIMDAAFEHRMYLPLATVAILFTTTVFYLLRSLISNDEILRPTFAASICVVAMCLVARTQLRNKDYVHPERLWMSAIEVSPRNNRAITNLGVAYADAGRHADAVEQYKHALSIKPKYAVANFNLADSLQLLSRFEEAIEASKKHLEIRPNSHRGHFQLGTIHERLRNFEEAKQSYRDVIKIKPDHGFAHYNLARLLAKSQETEQARQAFETAIAVNPMNAKFIEAYGNFFARQDQFERAIEQYKLAIKSDRSYPNVHLNLALALQKLGQFDLAINQLRQASRLFPGDTRFSENIAKIRKRKMPSAT